MLKRRATAAFCSMLVLLFAATPGAQQPAPSPVIVIRAGRLLDPDGGRILANNIIYYTYVQDVEGRRHPQMPISSAPSPSMAIK